MNRRANLAMLMGLVGLVAVGLAAIKNAPVVEERWSTRVDGTSTNCKFIDLETDGTDRLYFRYDSISDSGVELERSANQTVVWLTHVEPLNVDHEKYRHNVDVRIDEGKIYVKSVGSFGKISEVRALNNGALISRSVDLVMTEIE